MRLVLCVLLFVCSMLFCAQLSAADLLAQSGLRLQEARQELLQTRAAINKQREALLAAYAEAQAALGERRVAAATAAKQLERLRDVEAHRDSRAGEMAEDMRLRINRASAALSMEAPAQQKPEHCRQHWQRGIQALYAELDKQSALLIEKKAVAGRDGKERVSTVISFGAVQQIAVNEDALHSGLLLRDGDQDEVAVVNGPVPDQATCTALQQFSTTGSGLFLADPDGSLVTQRLINESWSDWLKKRRIFCVADFAGCATGGDTCC